ncbi:unnamed protein product [Prunus armeniaca]|uniref:MULE transposase domain-containing protein n=1 Tax=Prunus armeniaca TaxID=36596 RepID=A0A6J5XHD2_PRUAR|nr:unnamed protein product [Prunus armeniaca]
MMNLGPTLGVVIQELDDNYGAIVPVGGGVSAKGEKKKVVIEELNEEGLNQEAGGQGKELNEEGLIDEASKQGKETATVNNEENSDKGQEKPSQGCSDKGKGKDKDMSHRVKRAFGRVDGVRTEFQRHSMMLRSGRRLANAANFEDEDDDDDASDSEESNYMIPKNFSEDKDEDDVFFNEWVDDQTEWTWVKETGNEAVPDWPTDVELDSKDYECKDYAKYNYDEEVDKNWLKFNAATDMVDPKFEIGILFSDCKVFRAAVREYSILQNKDVVFIRNEALKLKAVCGDPDCGWMIYASKMQHENTLQVKTYIGVAKEGFKAGCRPIIGLDGCFLKSVYAGQLLTVVGIDANNETWVIGYAVVESECKESWIWFMELLVKDCHIVNQFGFTFISDKQKGLLPAFGQVVPNCDHRFCARHMFSNYRVFFKAKSLRDKFWEASYATTIPHFTRAM